jgi:hypothetical protein
MKLTPRMLNRIIKEEMAKFGKSEDVEDRASDTEETDADEFADSVAKKIDYVKALKVEEARLQRRLNRIAEARQRVIKSIKRA